MESREKNLIIGAITAVMGVILILYSMNIIIYMLYNPIFVFMTPSGYLYLTLFIIAIASFIYAYYMIKPVKTLKGKRGLAKIALVTGIVLILFPIIGMCLEAFYSSAYFGFSFYIMGFFIPYLIVIIPGLALTIHGKFMLNETKTDKR